MATAGAASPSHVATSGLNDADSVRIELPAGRRSFLYVGDDIIVAYGNRDAPDQFEAEVPSDLNECHLVAAGGIASRLRNKHSGVKCPTRIKPLGLLADAELRPLNLGDWKLQSRSIPKQLPRPCRS